MGVIPWRFESSPRHQESNNILFMKDQVKIQVFVPSDSVDKVRLALGKEGIGKIGNYDYNAFVTKGESYFRPLKDSNPTIGQIGKIKQVQESKLEFICEKENINRAIEVIKENHPYEEVAVDIFQLIDY